MVRDSLRLRLHQLRAALERRPRTLLIGCCGLVLSGGSMVWLGLYQQIDVSRQQPTLLELLDKVTSSTPKLVKDPSISQPPNPPRALNWQSPLAKQCSGLDQTVRKRLQGAQKSLRRRRQSIAIDPSNFGKRYSIDPWNNPINPLPRVVVLHETSYSLQSALNTFQQFHADENDQVSYHTLIGRSGSVIDVVDPLYRAYGAGFSAFLGEWAVTNPEFMGSVNNFALHLSLETPEDGHGGGQRHSGYTAEQYDALALVLDEWMGRFAIKPEAITTHQHVDLGGERGDPRSFDWAELQVRLAALNRLC
ncbi:MAG: peptidoglycan recognition family protein [Synechococcus sp.]|nr:peptidoglycan recognition family protein [Synechococcus sp.]